MARKIILAVVVVVVLFLVLILVGLLSSLNSGFEVPPRFETIPAGAVKMTPATDLYPPILRPDEWKAPIPMPGPVNTAGAEDSPFTTPDGSWFFFFFTPDLNIPVQNQLGDHVTGIWWTKNVGGVWTEPERLILGSTDSLEGDEFVQGATMWFGSVRAGNYGEIDIYSATHKNGKWTDVENVGQQLNAQIDIGAFCFTPDGNTMYYGKGGDIWKLVKVGSSWSGPEKVANLDSVSEKNQPFVTADGNELWFTGQSNLNTPGPAIFRSVKNGSVWDPPQEIVSRFAGEPTLDAAGNLYFVHHYVTQNISLIEADIYVAYHKGFSASSLFNSIFSGHQSHTEMHVSVGDFVSASDPGTVYMMSDSQTANYVVPKQGRR
jgi:hypothetical protein